MFYTGSLAKPAPVHCPAKNREWKTPNYPLKIWIERSGGWVNASYERGKAWGPWWGYFNISMMDTCMTLGPGPKRPTTLYTAEHRLNTEYYRVLVHTVSSPIVPRLGGRAGPPGASTGSSSATAGKQACPSGPAEIWPVGSREGEVRAPWGPWRRGWPWWQWWWL